MAHIGGNLIVDVPQFTGMPFFITDVAVDDPNLAYGRFEADAQ